MTDFSNFCVMPLTWPLKNLDGKLQSFVATMFKPDYEFYPPFANLWRNSFNA